MKNSIEELVQLAKAGNQEAISQLYKQTYTSVYQSVRALIKDEDEALDIVQDSYIKGFQNLDKLGDPQKFQAWMKVIATNRARDYLRKKRPTLFSERVDENGEEIDLRHQDDCPEHMPEVVIDRQETTRLMNDILGTLSEEQRLAIVMYYYEEKSIREIAAALSCTENTVKSRLNYGRKRIEAAVKALEKRGTKLYSLAPFPFFIWLLRMAKAHGITAAAVAKASTAGVAVGASSSAVGSTAAGTAAKAAGSAAGKALATKIVAGTLAVTMAAGAGAVMVHQINREKENHPIVSEESFAQNPHESENEKAHGIYRAFLDRYQDAFEMGQERFYLDYDRFWNEIREDILAQNPDINLNVTNDWYLDYTAQQDFADGTPLPRTVYEPNMSSQKLLANLLADEIICYQFCDIDDDGVDEMFVATVYRGELQRHTIDVYAVKNDTLVRGCVDSGLTDGKYTWRITTCSEAAYVDPGVVYINLGTGVFDEPVIIDEPSFDWTPLFPVGGEAVPTADETVPAETESPEDAAIDTLAGSYRYEIPLDVLFGRGDGGYNIFHDFSVTVTDTEIIIEDRGEPLKSVENRNAFMQALHGPVDSGLMADTYLLSETEQQYLTFDSFGTLRINRDSIVFIDEDTFMFDETGFEGSSAPNGMVNALSFGDSVFSLYYYEATSPAMHVVLGDWENASYYQDAVVHGIIFFNNETYPPK